jgi:hypothetical protein
MYELMGRIAAGLIGADARKESRTTRNDETYARRVLRLNSVGTMH